MEAKDPAGVEPYLQHQFSNQDLLHEALRHSSYVNELVDQNLKDNERLEFLGDAVLNLVVGDLLMRHYPDLKEGDLSRSRADLVNEYHLAKIAQSFDLGSFLQLGKGEIQTGGQEKSSILANTFEALTAAVYVDGGFDAAYQFIERYFLPYIELLQNGAKSHDYKSQLQERVQIEHAAMPDYSIIDEEGPDHDKTFRVVLKVFDIETRGIGKSKKAAEQDAARKAMGILQKEP